MNDVDPAAVRPKRGLIVVLAVVLFAAAATLAIRLVGTRDNPASDDVALDVPVTSVVATRPISPTSEVGERGSPEPDATGERAAPGMAAIAGTGGASGPERDARQLAALAALPPAPTPDAYVALARTEPPDRDLVDLARRLGRTTGDAPRTLAERPPEPAVGDKRLFWVHDIVAERYFQVTATLRTKTDAAYFWIQDGDAGYDPARLESGAQEFSQQVVPDLRAVFGDEWRPGVDLDDRMHVLHHEPIRGVAGYYSSADEFTTPVEPHSNEREMFYINLSVFDPGSYDWLALLAHEFQHMVHWNKDKNESVWANEGLSELAAVLAGYPAQDGGQFFSDPDTPLLEWNEDPNKNAPDYAASFAFFSYVLGRFGEDAIRAIVAAPQNGPEGIEAGLASIGITTTFDDLFLDWVVANALDDPTVSDGRFSYRTQAMTPVRPKPLESAATGATVGPYATDYYNATAAVSGGKLAVDFAGDTVSGLLGDGSAGHGSVWWSNRGDGADSRLTFDTDLTQVPAGSAAALEFDLWHDLEGNWDFAYFLVSRDGGATWEKIATARTTDLDPNGNNFGSGLTGRSDGWVQERLDLAPYAGGKALVRFEVVTDDAVSLSGLALDNVRLTTAPCNDGSCEGRELWSDDGGALTVADGSGLAGPPSVDAAGFHRVVPQVPERWAVQAIIYSGGRILAVQRPVIDPSGEGRIEVDVPPNASAVVAVSRLTPGTRYPSSYRLETVSRAVEATP